MQQFGFALVPVLAGYWLLTRTHLLKRPYETKTHHRVFFEPAVVGGALFIASWLVVSILAPIFDDDGRLACIADIWLKVVDFEHSPVLLLTIALALAVPPLINRRVDPVAAENRWAVVNETVRGRILRESFENGRLVEILLNSRQSHIGIVSTSPRPDFEGDVTLAPELSGFRDPVTQKLAITSEYDQQGDDFRIVCLLDEVTSISHFDPRSPYIDWAIP